MSGQEIRDLQAYGQTINEEISQYVYTKEDEPMIIAEILSTEDKNYKIYLANVLAEIYA